MSKQLLIENFGPITKAEIEIKPMLVLIGAQASGKSTIAKLIYFFQQIPTDFFSNFYQSNDYEIDIFQHLIIPIRSKFYEYFGSTYNHSEFKIEYKYAENRFLTLTLNPEKKLNAHFSNNFFSEEDNEEIKNIKKSLHQIYQQQNQNEKFANRVALEKKQLDFLHQLNKKINEIFCNNHNDSLFIIAGRNATVGYSETFENLFRQSLQRKIEAQAQGKEFIKNQQTIDETLMLSFMEKTSIIKQSFINLGNFDGIINNTSGNKKYNLELANNMIANILHGEYKNSSNGEVIVHNNNFVYLRDASSGQQEAIRILQDAFLNIYQENNFLRIVEEPEAHLFPESQMYTIQLLTLALNCSTDSNLILTTHSPYTLTTINNLIYAAKVGNINKSKTENIIPKEIWLNPSNVSAYIISNKHTENIIDNELQEIKAEKIDEVSDLINNQYGNLMNLEYAEKNN